MTCMISIIRIKKSNYGIQLQSQNGPPTDVAAEFGFPHDVEHCLEQLSAEITSVWIISRRCERKRIAETRRSHEERAQEWAAKHYGGCLQCRHRNLALHASV